MLDQETKKRIFDARDILVGKIPDPKAQVEQITTALIYKFMADMDYESEGLGGEPQFFTGEYTKYAWSNLVDTRLGGEERFDLYVEALNKMPQNPSLPQLFRDMLKNAFLPYRDPETLRLFLKKINEFTYDHSEKLGDAFEYLLSVLGSQGDAGQFRTPRHIIDFIVEVLDPQKGETILDPACGTGGFLISSYKHILRQNMLHVPGDQLTPDEKTKLMNNFIGYDISPDMVRLCLVNMYLHNFPNPVTYEYDTLTSDDRWDETGDLIMANPPFMSPTGGIRPHKRFSIQAKRSEILFVDYIAEHLNSNGRAGIIVPEGIIFQSGTAYKALRKMLVEKYLYAVVSLPAGVFNPYSGVKTSILLMDKRLAKIIKTILFVKIENDGFDLGAQRKPIDKNDLQQTAPILKYYRQGLLRGEDIGVISDDVLKKASKIIIVEKAVLAKKGDYNLSGDRYKVPAKNIRQNWPMLELGEVCEIFNGSTPLRSKKDFWENGNISWFTVDDIREQGRIITRTIQKITQKALEETSIKILPPQALLLCCTASVGEFAITEIPLTTNQQFNGLVIKEQYNDKLLPKYLFWIAATFKLELERLSGKTSFNFVSVGTLKTINLPMPPISIQQEIVIELDRYQKIVEGAKQVIANYKPQIKVSPDCQTVELGQLCDKIQYGISEPMNSEGKGYKTFRMHELKDGLLIDNGNMKFADILPSEYHKYKLNKDDILFNRTNSYELVGRTGIFKLSGEYCFASYLIRLMVNKALALPDYINYFMNTDHFQTTIKLKATQAIGQANINAKSLAEYELLLPSLEVQEQIVTRINEERELVRANIRLVEIFEQKIKDKISEVLGRGDANIDAEPEIRNNYIAAPEEMEFEVPQIEQVALFTSF